MYVSISIHGITPLSYTSHWKDVSETRNRSGFKAADHVREQGIPCN